MVLCGASSVRWSAFIKLIMILSSKTAMPANVPGLIQALTTIRPSVTELGDTNDFPRLLRAICPRQCFDPRDKIYGILGILSKMISDEIEPDYQSSVAEVYKHATLTDIHTSKRIQMLQSCDYDLRIPEAPSWVTNWVGISGRQQLPTYYGGIGRILLDASGCTPVGQVSPSILEVVGQQCARVVQVGPPASATAKDQVRAFRDVTPADLDDEYITGGTFLDALISIVTLGRVKERFPHSILYPSIAESRIIYRHANSSSHQDLEIQKPNDEHIDGLKFIATKEGYIGVTLSGAQPGDFVYIILGVESPMILRPGPNGNLLVVGPCFVHGLMNAESILGPMPTGWDFILTRDRGFPEKSYAFITNAGGQRTKEDPRLPPLSPLWHKVDEMYRNSETGEARTRDPRLTPEALMARCPSLTKIRLI